MRRSASNHSHLPESSGLLRRVITAKAGLRPVVRSGVTGPRCNTLSPKPGQSQKRRSANDRSSGASISHHRKSPTSTPKARRAPRSIIVEYTSS